jgi:signal transduction histidine kinase
MRERAEELGGSLTITTTGGETTITAWLPIASPAAAA